MRLCRPVGPAELALIEASGWRCFPPRLPEQPIFYPVLNFEYAEQIARDWNSKSDADKYEGHVLVFDVAVEVAERYPPQSVGAAGVHREFWGQAKSWKRSTLPSSSRSNWSQPTATASASRV